MVAVPLGKAPGEREIDAVVIENADQRARHDGGDDAARRERGREHPCALGLQNRGRSRLKRRMCQIAATPSFHPIFFPSA